MITVSRMLAVLCAALAAASVSGFAPQNHAAAPPTLNPTAASNPAKSALSMAQTNDLFGSIGEQLGGFFGGAKAEPVEPEKPALPDAVIDPDFKLAGIFLAAGAALDLVPYVQLTLGPLVTLLGVLFLVQTFRVRFVFTEDKFELKQGGDDLEDAGENIVVGGANEWSYDSFVNWEFFPKGWEDSPQGPILVYFKETQTPSDKWTEGPGAKANSEEAIAAGAVPGQVHFFPALCDAQQIKREFERRGCAKL